jgi:hypothetical protein
MSGCHFIWPYMNISALIGIAKHSNCTAGPLLRRPVGFFLEVMRPRTLENIAESAGGMTEGNSESYVDATFNDRRVAKANSAFESKP